MDNLKNLIGVKKIEYMFAENISFFSTSKDEHKTSTTRKITIIKIYSVLSLLNRRFYRLLPNIFKDIFFWAWASHKAPATRLFARTKYDELRIKLDIKVSSLALRSAPVSIADKLQDTFSSGFYETHIRNISAINQLIDNVLHYSIPSHAGARPYFKDGKNQKIENSFSAYYSLSDEDNKKVTLFLNNAMEADFNYYLSVLAGYHCKLEDISYSLGVVFGENSNSEMHQDTFSSIAKGFIYLQDIDDTNSPFEYLTSSYLDAAFRSLQTNKAVLCDDFHSSGSTRLRGSELDDAISRYELKTFTGAKGNFVLANTSGYHRKGAHNSIKPRITLNFEIKRKGIIGKLIRNFFAIMRFRISHIFNSNA